MTLFVCVPGEPRGKQRPRATVRGGFAQFYTPEATREAENAIQIEARLSMQGRGKFEGPVSVDIQMFHSIRKSWPKAKKEAARLGKVVPTIKVDADNCIKLYLDAFNGVVWVDDVQVVDLRVSKRFSDNPCVIVIVSPLDLDSA